MVKGKVKYKSAYDENHNLVTLTPGYKVNGKFTCPNPECKLEMIPKQGDFNSWHFAHKGKECDYDRYLHTIAELRIQEWYNKADKVNITYPIEVICPVHSNCKLAQNNYSCKKDSIATADLKKYWPQCEKETEYKIGESKFVPDLLCRDKDGKDRPLFIEICVTHPCEIDKLNSGVRIIELFIKSEDDIDLIIKDGIVPSDMVLYHNFQKKEKMGAREDFNQILNKVVILDSFRTNVNPVFCKDIEKRRGILELTLDRSLDIQVLSKYGGSYCVAQALAYKYIPDYRSCYVCVNCRKTYGSYICVAPLSDSPNHYCKGKYPKTCPYFKPDESIINRRICAFEDFKRKYPVDIYIKQK